MLEHRLLVEDKLLTLDGVATHGGQVVLPALSTGVHKVESDACLNQRRSQLHCGQVGELIGHVVFEDVRERGASFFVTCLRY